MPGDQVRVLGPEGPVRASEVKLSELGHRERQDLQEWIVRDPGLLEDGLMVLTVEFDRWASSDGLAVRDRLDILALSASGQLVVVELKRDDAPTDIHLQAITYAAMVSRFSEDQLVAIHRDFLRRRGKDLDEDDVRGLIRSHLEGEPEPQMLRQVRTILVARRFPRQVTSSSVWLSEMGIDVKLVVVRAYDVLGQPILTTSTLYPVPGTEEFTVVPARMESAKATARASERVRQRSTTLRIIESGVLQAGDELTFQPYSELPPEVRATVVSWVDEDESRGRATWVADAGKPLLWAHDNSRYAPTTLVKEIVELATGSRPVAVWGPRWWVDAQGRDLVAVAEAGDPTSAVGAP